MSDLNEPCPIDLLDQKLEAPKAEQPFTRAERRAGAVAVVCALRAPAREAVPILPKSITARVNRFAHQSGQRCSAEIRDFMLDRLRQAVKSGTARDELLGTLTEMEAAINPCFRFNSNS